MEKKNNEAWPLQASMKPNKKLITVASATAATSELTSATTTTTTWALFAGTRDIDRESPAGQLFTVQRVNRFLSLLRRAHSNEPKPARPASGPVHHQVGFEHCTVGGERVLQVVFGDVETKVPYKQFCTHQLTITVRD